MKKYTQEEFDNFEIDEDGNKICPTGDYTDIKAFGERCRFGKCCIFGADCIFGVDCIFDADCIFGAHCHFGAGCSFRARCSFRERCRFGEGAARRFGRCHFRGPLRRALPARVTALEWCLEMYCNLKMAGSKPFRRRTGARREKHIFKGDNGYFVRAGCFFIRLTSLKTSSSMLQSLSMKGIELAVS
ncbi:MAG: hypothetical protein ACLVKR_00870 [Lachnospiraceae bacterium]